MEVRIADIHVGNRKRTLDTERVESLAGSIGEIGLLNPLTVTPTNQLVSGLHRLEACRFLGWEEVEVTVIDLPELQTELAEIDENLIRNELSYLERGEHLLRRKEIYEALHPETKHGGAPGIAGGGKRTKEGIMPSFVEDAKANIGQSATSVQRDIQIARDIPDNFHTTIEKLPIAENKADLLSLARLFKSDASEAEAVVEKLGTGAADKLAEARTQVKRERKVAASAIRVAELPDIGDRYRLICGDLCNVDLEAESVDVIITDPPYPKEYLPLWENLAVLAERVLKPGGSLVAMSGQSYLPEILALITPHLSYHWMLAYMTPGATLQVFGRDVLTGWKPVLWFVKGDYKGEWVWDVARSDKPDKEHHDWGQSESGMADLIEKFSRPGDIVLDPFLGGGTTAIVALQLDRQVIGIDIEAGAIETTKERIAEWLQEER